MHFILMNTKDDRIMIGDRGKYTMYLSFPDLLFCRSCMAPVSPETRDLCNWVSDMQ